MPSLVSSIIEKSGLYLGGSVKWGYPISERRPGIYIISTSSNPMTIKAFEKAPLSYVKIKEWIDKVPNLLLDDRRPTPEEMLNRLSSFWLPDESIVYIGKAGTSIKQRVRQFYITELGEPRPHAGGHWIQTLSILNDLYVYWAVTDSPDMVEGRLLSMFVNNVSRQAKNAIFDSEKPFPFANLEYPKGNRKVHNIRNTTNNKI